MADKQAGVTVVAELAVTSEGRAVSVKGFESAWVLANELPRPVHIEFVRFVRK